MLKELFPYLAIAPASIYSLLSLYCAERYFADQQLQPTADGREFPPITILKPVKGEDAGSYENFASFCTQDYAGSVQLLFAVASADDPVIAVIHRIQADFPHCDVALVINPAIHGPNYKVSNLINAFPAARHDILIVCDSDIRVAATYLQRVSAWFSDPAVGLVTSLYRTSEVDGVAAALEALGFTVEMIPNVLVALRLEGLSFALGASMAVRRQALNDIGGFEALADYLADDYQLGNKIHRAGWQIRLDSCFVESMIRGENLMAVLSRQVRWARTMRVSRPGGYLASGITLPFPALLVALLFAGSLPAALTAVALLYLIRMTVSVIVSKRFVRDGLLPTWLWLVPVRDMLSFFCWGLSFMGNRVQWRGSRFQLKSGGKLEELV